MAILYGTTADGDSLPVEVNEFGQLVAQGLQGQEGPPGPPGVGQLPPDPFEGAILGWKDNTLAWLGGSVPLPEGTFGPIIEYANGILTLEDEVSLPYLAAIFLSDAAGNRWFYTPTSSPITDVTDASMVVDNVGTKVLTLTDDTNLANFRVGDVVQDGPPGSGYLVPNTGFTNPGEATPGTEYYWLKAFDGTNAQIGNFATVIFADPIPYSTSVKLSPAGNGQYVRVNDDPFQDAGPTNTLNTVVSGTGFVNSISMSNDAVGTNGGYAFYMTVDGTAVVITAGEPVKVTAIDEDAPSMTVSGGTWEVGQVVSGPLKSGEGTVQSTTSNAIVLRENNDEWCVGKYVTAPEQNLAARYVYEEELKKKLL